VAGGFVRLLLELSMECESLARSEAVSAAKALGGHPRVVMSDPGVIVLDSVANPVELSDRIALCHHVSEWLGSVELSGLEAVAEQVRVPGPVRVRSTRIGEHHQDADLAAITRNVGGILGGRVGVDIHSPESDIRVVVSGSAHIGRVISSVDRPSYESRKNNNLPFKYPVSLHPKYARALVNLTEVPRGGTVLDPFCGTGALLAEASLAGLKAVGSDMSEKMVKGARLNLEHVGARAELHVCDVGSVESIAGDVDGIVTDPPYGRSTSTNGEPLPELYSRSFRVFSDLLGRGSRMAIALPELGMLDDAFGFKVVETHPLWVHRSLTRNFCVLEKT
jgi:tRNA (guanine10-N2)-dimethyltransferase